MEIVQKRLNNGVTKKIKIELTVWVCDPCEEVANEVFDWEKLKQDLEEKLFDWDGDENGYRIMEQNVDSITIEG